MSWVDSIRGLIGGGRTAVSTAGQAKERLMVVISHERGSGQSKGPEFLPKLQEELMQLLSRYMPIDSVEASVQFAQQDGADMLKVDIMMPGMK